MTYLSAYFDLIRDIECGGFVYPVVPSCVWVIMHTRSVAGWMTLPIYFPFTVSTFLTISWPIIPSFRYRSKANFVDMISHHSPIICRIYYLLFLNFLFICRSYIFISFWLKLIFERFIRFNFIFDLLLKFLIFTSFLQVFLKRKRKKRIAMIRYFVNIYLLTLQF